MEKLFTFLIAISTTAVFGQQNPSDFLPEGYVVFEQVHGDLNQDGVDDCVLVIKGTDPDQIVQDEYRGELDRNRRGLIVLFGGKDGYELAIKNKHCFSSENEDGGVYFPPELFVDIDKGNLYIHYGHGRYGYWTYTFKYRNSDFELIGYDSSSHFGPIVNRQTSINFLTKKKQVKENVNDDPDQESGDEIFKETWVDIEIEALVKLSEVEDFDMLDMRY